MVGNRETVEQLLTLLEERELRGQVILHCKRGRIMDLEVCERLEPPWKQKVASSEGNALD